MKEKQKLQEELENMKREIEKNEPYEKLLREVSKMKKNWQPTLFEDLFKVYFSSTACFLDLTSASNFSFKVSFSFISPSKSFFVNSSEDFNSFTLLLSCTSGCVTFKW